jgi:curved DNA-binding protein CbpA
MRLDDCYRLLDLDPNASDDEVRRAHRDLTKVWHPDRFGEDAPLRLRAEEKLKTINEAYETICKSRGRGRPEAGDKEDEQHLWQVRFHGREMRFRDLDAIVRLAERGSLSQDAEVFDQTSNRWVPLSTVPRVRDALVLARARRDRGWALTFGSLAFLILLRRPTPGGLLIALLLGGAALYFMSRARIRD